MKILIASDLHGSALYCRKLKEAFSRENADKLLLLGDILYHGPRNDLPENYSPKEVIAQLDEIKDKVLCVCGNCEAEIDRLVLPFPTVSDLGVIFVDGLNIYFAHGHKDEPELAQGDIYLTGHTHIQENYDDNGHRHLNPGSVSIPKENSKRGYILYENRKFIFKDLDGQAFDEYDVDKKDTPAEEPEKVQPTVHRAQVGRKKYIIRRR